MGGGEWTTNVWTESEARRKAAGKSTFAYSHATTSRPRDLWKVHPDLDPKGVRFRESRDSEDHPESLAIAALFDVTGSMLDIPVELQKKLPELNSLLIRKGYVKHPQIMFGAIGDATIDRVPLQVGQFESDNRMDQNLDNIILEGGGGGQKTESYELAMYFMARHTDIDCFNKRHHRGYLFMIGDEMAYPQVNSHEVASVIGDRLGENIPTARIVAELKQHYEAFYILPTAASHGQDSEVLSSWRKLLGQNVLELQNLDMVCETIALQIGMNEGTIDLDTGLGHLKEYGLPKSAVSSVERALAPRNNALARATGSLPGLGSKDLTARSKRL